MDQPESFGRLDAVKTGFDHEERVIFNNLEGVSILMLRVELLSGRTCNSCV